MDTGTVLMIVGLVINFMAMMIGGLKILSVTVQYHVVQERRMATIEQQIRQLMGAANMTVRET
jgi:hypothetical protein